MCPCKSRLPSTGSAKKSPPASILIAERKRPAASRWSARRQDGRAFRMNDRQNPGQARGGLYSALRATCRTNRIAHSDEYDRHVPHQGFQHRERQVGENPATSGEGASMSVMPPAESGANIRPCHFHPSSSSLVESIWQHNLDRELCRRCPSAQLMRRHPGQAAAHAPRAAMKPRPR